jgi:hypothetical protein
MTERGVDYNIARRHLVNRFRVFETDKLNPYTGCRRRGRRDFDVIPVYVPYSCRLLPGLPRNRCSIPAGELCN